MSVERPEKLPLEKLCPECREIMQNALIQNLSCDIGGVRKKMFDTFVSKKEVLAVSGVITILWILSRIFKW
jgi:hypothetical protein